MLEQWEADQLLLARKVYSHDTVVDLGYGADNDYQVETDNGLEFFLLDVRGPSRNPSKARFQLRYRRNIVLARMCLAGRHTNPDGERFDGPHFHRYREGYGDKFADPIGCHASPGDALEEFCHRVNLPTPKTQGGPA